VRDKNQSLKYNISQINTGSYTTNFSLFGATLGASFRKPLAQSLDILPYPTSYTTFTRYISFKETLSRNFCLCFPHSSTPDPSAKIVLILVSNSPSYPDL
jgi:hypothetical protein